MLSPKKWNQIGVSFLMIERIERTQYRTTFTFPKSYENMDLKSFQFLLEEWTNCSMLMNHTTSTQMETFAAFLEETYGDDPDAFFLISGDLHILGRNLVMKAQLCQ